MNPIENKRQVTRLMLLFMTTYLISYLTRVNYAAVVTEIADAEGILRSVASLALTGSAVTYGVGQLLSGWLGDRIQPRTLVFCGLLTTLLTNLLIPLCGRRLSDDGGLVCQRPRAGVYVAAACAADVHAFLADGL